MFQAQFEARRKKKTVVGVVHVTPGALHVELVDRVAVTVEQVFESGRIPVLHPPDQFLIGGNYVIFYRHIALLGRIRRLNVIKKPPSGAQKSYRM